MKSIRQIIKEEIEDYRGSHTAPSPDADDSPMHDVTDKYGEDIYTSKALRMFGGYGAYDNYSIALIQRARNKPNMQVKIYRAVPAVITNQDKINDYEKQKAYILKTGRLPKGVDNWQNSSEYHDYISNEIDKLKSLPSEQDSKVKINSGDWVTINPAYAREHGQSNLNNKFRVLSKTVPAKTLFTDGNSIHEWGYWEGGTVKEDVQAWHGSPYDFDKFDVGKMGSGEGAQAFGWGLYFTDLKSIANRYSKIKQNVDALAQYIFGLKYTRENLEQIEAMSNAELIKLVNQAYERKTKEINDKYGEESKYGTNPKAEDFKEHLLATQYELRDKYVSELLSTKPTNYQVTLHKGKTPDQYDWLLWDKPITMQQREKISNQAAKENIEFFLVKNNAFNSYVEKIQDKMKKSTGEFAFLDRDSLQGQINLKLYYIVNEVTGKEVYDLLSGKYFNSPKKASLFLLRAGIDGIKYPAESIARGMTSDTARGFNYVVFDPNAVTIEKKFTNENVSPKSPQEIANSLVTDPRFKNGTVLVNLDVKLADEAFKRDEGFYIGKDDKGIGIRKEKVMELIKNGELKYAPEASIYLTPDGKPRLSFGDGRHRFAVLRDLGVETINVSIWSAPQSKRLIPLLQRNGQNIMEETNNPKKYYTARDVAYHIYNLLGSEQQEENDWGFQDYYNAVKRWGKTWVLREVNPNDLREITPDSELNAMTVQNYVDDINNGKDIPPIVVMKDRVIIDGNHRAKAAKITDKNIKAFIPVDVAQNLREEIEKSITLDEGIDFHIKDYGLASERPTDNYNISNILLHNALSKDSMDNWTEEQIQYFRKNSFGFYNTIVPDGGTDDVINYYPTGTPPERVPIILKEIERVLAKYGVKLLKTWKERENTKNEVIRFQVELPNIQVAPEMHLAQGNAVELIKLLGFEQNVSSGLFGMDTTDINTEVTLDQMKKGIERAEYYLGEIDKPDKTQMTHQGNVYAFHVGKDQLREYLRRLKEMVAYAEKYGYTKIDIS